MNDDYPPPIIFIVIVYVLFVTSISDNTILIILTGILIIIGLISAVIYFLTHRASRRDKEQPIIRELISNFIITSISQLNHNSLAQNFNFPDSLNYWFGITKGNLFKRFAKRKKIMGWRVSRYNKFGDKINNEIKEFANRVKGYKLIEWITNKKGSHWILTEEYEDLSQSDLNKLLEEHNLTNDIEQIEELMKKISIKAEKLSKKLKKLKDKWKEKYNIPNSSLEW